MIETEEPTSRTAASRADLHCHSTASVVAKLGVQDALGLPECATPPEEVYELAKRRGMDFVTITDHDTIAGALEIADRPDVFVSEELTAGFRDEPQRVHVLCLGIDPDDHDWLQGHAADVEACAEYLHEREIACALAHPFYNVAAPLAPRHRRRLAQLFPIWETRNGTRARELNAPAAVYIETHGGIGVAGSDDHAGVDVGRTFTETPHAATPDEFLAMVRGGHAEPCGEQGSAPKWAHTAMALALRAIHVAEGPPPDPRAVLSIVQRVVSQGSARSAAAAGELAPDDARAVLRAWLQAVGLEGSPQELLARLQADDFSHAALFRQARRVHERGLQRAVRTAATELGSARPAHGDHPLDWASSLASDLFRSSIAAVPYAPAAAFLAKEKAKLATREGDPRRVALVADAIGATHGVARTIEEIRDRGVPGVEVEVIGTDPDVDHRLPAVAEVDVPLYPGLRVGVPSMPAIVEALAEGRYDLVHLCSPGPAGVGAALVARMMELPTLGSYHTELARYAGLRGADPVIEQGVRAGLALFYGACDVVLSPSTATDRSLAELGVPGERIGRWERGVDLALFSPARRVERLRPGAVNVLYAGRQTREKGVELLADAFLAARRRDPRLHMVLAGGGPEEAVLRERLGEHATFLGWLEGEELARAYASSDVLLFPSRTDTFGQVVLEAQASGLPVVAVDEGGPADLVDHARTGLLAPPDADALADAVIELVRSPVLSRRLAGEARERVRVRTWEAALGQLAAGYQRALDLGPAPVLVRAA